MLLWLLCMTIACQPWFIDLQCCLFPFIRSYQSNDDLLLLDNTDTDRCSFMKIQRSIIRSTNKLIELPPLIDELDGINLQILIIKCIHLTISFHFYSYLFFNFCRLNRSKRIWEFLLADVLRKHRLFFY